MNVYTKINAVMADLSKEGIGKDRKNAQQGYNFRGIDDVLNALSSLLVRHSLVVLPNVLEQRQVERTTMKGNPIFYSFVHVEFHFIDADNPESRHVVTTWGEAMDSADKATNKAMSAAYKYAAILAFCIPTVGDEGDADSVTHEVQPSYISHEQQLNIKGLITDAGLDEAVVLAKVGIRGWEYLPKSRYDNVLSRIQASRKAA
jgi:hypothetical protein